MRMTPNTRMQRTRSSALLRSPLSRKPLCDIRAPVVARRLLTIFIGSAVACCGASGYEGDGEARGYGSGFVLRLGPLDVTRPGRATFKMKGLSSSEFVFGLRSTQRPVEAVVRISLVNGRGQAVIQDEAPLSDWVWSYSRGPDTKDYFLYRRGQERETPLGGGSVRLEQVGLKADGGWGTYFHPQRRDRYVLQIEVVRPASSAAALSAEVQCAEVYSP
jgi:hypothetical protein